VKRLPCLVARNPTYLLQSKSVSVHDMANLKVAAMRSSKRIKHLVVQK
jgi:hypothetical protein